MKNYIQKNPMVSFIALIVLILLVGALVHSSLYKGSAMHSSDTYAVSTSTENMSSSTATISGVQAGQPTLAYSVTIATSTYGQNQIIPITITVLNLTNASTTLSFKNGCMGNYDIGGFDMLAHTSCLPAPASIVVAPHNIRQVQVVHYPSVFKLPPGNYTLTAYIVGYGGQSVPITITQ